MLDWNHPCAQRFVEELKKPLRAERLFKMAVWFVIGHPKWGREPEDEARELVAEATECVCDPDRKPWDPAKKTFLLHMQNVMRQILVERDRSARAEHEIADSAVWHEDLASDPLPLPDAQLHDARKLAWLRAMGQILLDRLEASSDTIAAQSLVLGKIGMSHEEQAREIGCSVQDVENAEARLKYHGQIVRDAWEKREAQRMKSLREEDKKVAGKRLAERRLAAEEEE